ncbi:MAG: thiamine pyrophosphate-dependent dehydrogenase E1 component subunit alpha [Bacteroidota bacterium]
MHYTPEFLTGLYKTMLRIRLAEESFVEPIVDGSIRCPVHLYSGQEAVATGLGANLNKEDYVFGNHRSHGHYLAKGGDLDAMIAEVYCRKSGCAKGRGGSMHLVDKENGIMGIAPIVAGTISLALGAALAASIRKDKRVSVTFFGDGATGEGVLYESMNFASLKKLPIIFACENNLYSTHLSIREIRVKNEIADVAEPFGIRTFRVDGNDVMDVYEAARDAVAHCRSGAGPVFMEFFTYRLRGHVGPDDNVQGVHTDIRPQLELEAWTKNDPILKFENYLVDQNIVKKENLEILKSELVAEVKASVERAVSDSFPDANEVEEYVFRKKN